MSRRVWLPLAVTLAGSLLAAPAANATFHDIKVREVYSGSNDDSYVELQMYASGQNLVATHSLTLYDSSGALTHTSTFSANVSNGANQATVLIGDTNVATAFGVAPDLVDAGLNVPSAGGAACWIAGTAFSADCVAWGSFPGPTAPAFETQTATSAGAPVSATGITAGKAIRRKITPGCSTLLEAGDDSNDSATDFEEVNPAPRDNASATTETTCSAPTATIDTKPANPTNSTTASFTYHSTPSGASFECKLDAAAFASCEPSGIAYAGPLAAESHTFQVRATNVHGTGTAASYTWQIDTTPPEATILSHPQDPGPGNSASFTYSSNEAGSTFQCSLEPNGEPEAFSSCPSTGKTYPDAEHPGPLADGSWTFEVRATDRAGNLSSPGPFPMGTFSWQVDNSLADTTPPETTILSRPPDPSDSSTAGFAYESNEPGSGFECRLDGAGFASCPAAGITYTGLAGGPHTFLVRAIDSSGNVDPTPAGYTFGVVATVPTPTLAQAPPAPPPPPPAPPETRITAGPSARTRDRTPTVRFDSSSPGARFQCRLDRTPFHPCRSPFTAGRLSPGPHLFAVRAIASGMVEAVPATTRFTVLRSRHRRRDQRRRAG